MVPELSDRVREIATANGVSELEVVERALERGLEILWVESVLSQYFDGSITREEAVDRVGRSTVDRAEREREIVEEDGTWGDNERRV